MKVCVFGASGYVGSSVYKRLKEIPKVSVSGTYLDEPPLFDDLTRLDINEPESFSDFYKAEQPDVIVWSVMSGPQEQQLTEQGLMHLLTHITPETKLVYISSDYVYSAGKGPYSETDPVTTLPDEHKLSNYANGKVKAERFIANELTNYVIVRVGPVFGENQIGKMDERTDRLSYHLRAGKAIHFRDDLFRTFCHVEDLAEVIVEMVSNDIVGVFNAGSTEPKSFYEFMGLTAEQLGFDPGFVEKASEEEEVDQEIPKNTSLHTEKIKELMKQQKM
ncbi:sugar nucleotide-binding protein [Virgibacillus salexigens]|uniref:sugar nucleotide-binding protein n=1 Tax=Virgibacillus TaxID=84406 RepID=UPI00136B9228|nr:sugar nucleotide-binding protein [Virgibacillus massiliensis]MYL40956.1 sugar nucleotide-binding protein [Virgibacillus massiliensis]